MPLSVTILIDRAGKSKLTPGRLQACPSSLYLQKILVAVSSELQDLLVLLTVHFSSSLPHLWRRLTEEQVDNPTSVIPRIYSPRRRR